MMATILWQISGAVSSSWVVEGAKCLDRSEQMLPKSSRRRADGFRKQASDL